jgi:ABC-type branched-subunit amino acid transport system permease subunit
VTARDLLPIVAVVAIIALAPLFTSSNTVLNFLTFALIVALAAQGWNILGGFGGQFSFGHAAFFGTGAYATAILQMRFGVNAWVGFGLGLAAGALIGAAIGYLSFRSGLRGSYFALVTLAFAEVFRIVANAAETTGGAAGMLIRLDVRPSNFQFGSRAAFFWIALALVALTLALTRWIERSRFGARLVAIRENEEAAQALGVDTLRTKLAAIALSGAVTGAAGCLLPSISSSSMPTSPMAPGSPSRRCWRRSSAAPARHSVRWPVRLRFMGSARRRSCSRSACRGSIWRCSAAFSWSPSLSRRTGFSGSSAGSAGPAARHRRRPERCSLRSPSASASGGSTR